MKELTRDEAVDIADEKGVTIYKNTETGEEVWSVQVNTTDYWLTSYRTKMAAIAYCELHDLTYEVK
jgi:hypothetical protein